MFHISEVLRLTAAGWGQRRIALVLGLSHGAVGKYQAAARRVRLAWPDCQHLDENALRARLELTPPPARRTSIAPDPAWSLPDFPVIHQELKRKGVTRQLLWEEYRAAQPQPYSYTQFCVLYQEWRQRLKLSMRQTHLAGEKLFVDYAGPTVPLINPTTGGLHAAQIFVAVLGASNYTYAEATYSQALPDWIGSHVRAFQFFGGVPALVVPDNLKSAVTQACRYEPLLNESYARMLAHYGSAALPARPYHPRDKAKAEAGVQLVERWLLARLRHETFHDLYRLNLSLRGLLADLNARPFQKLPGSRHSQFLALDQPALRPLPATPYEYAEWKKARVHLDYHVEFERHYYSVPHKLVKRQVELRVTERLVEVYYQQQLVAAHARSRRAGAHSTQPGHMPTAHRAQMEWTPGRFLTWAARIGPATRDLARHLLTTPAHPEMGYRSCLGLLSLARQYDAPSLEAACQRAQALGAPSRRTVAHLLQHALAREPLPETAEPPPILTARHENVRGPEYYR